MSCFCVLVFNNLFPNLTRTTNASLLNYCRVILMLFKCLTHSGASSVRWTPSPMEVWPALRCLEVKEDFSMAQINILGRVPMDTDVSPWWEDTFYEQSTQALVNTMDLVQEIILQTEYHLNQAQVEANLARKTAENLSRSSTRSARYAYTWWDWTFRGCVLASGIIFFVTLCRCCYFRCLIRTMRTSTNVAIALSPLKVPALRKL